MVKFTISKVDGSEEKIKLFDYLPARVGMKARSKLGVGLETDGTKAEVEMENALERADDALGYIVTEMLNRSDTDLEVDDLAYKSFQDIAQYYWKQVQGEQVKN